MPVGCTNKKSQGDFPEIQTNKKISRKYRK
jgi:hypothetical protein